ncbi:calcium-binding protein [Methylomonas sp. MED-D]|uniref:calcium-binding protein n=1 Tax=Methylomonas sp. MED-D TaxID=3418768 RepID=UPI003D079A94
MIKYSFFQNTQDYVDAVVDVISRAEGYIQYVKNIGDGKATIGYGYTFERNDNVTIWKNANITLSDEQWVVLKKIDLEPILSQKTTIAISEFSKNLTNLEAKLLLGQTYQNYESAANELAVPQSWERVALVSITYNRGLPAIHNKMQGFYDAIYADDRAEAWFQIRYNAQTSNPNFVDGIAKRRYYESEIFSLYDPDTVDEAQARQIYAMYNRHHDDILNYEATYGSQISNANRDYHLSPDNAVQTLENSLQKAASVLIGLYLPDSLGDAINPLDIQLATEQQLDLIGAKRDGYRINVGADQNDLLIGNNQANTLQGLGGSDILVGNGGDDTLIGGTDSDTLLGGEGNDIYVVSQGDGFDTLIDSDGQGHLYWSLTDIQGDGNTAADKWKKFSATTWQDQTNLQDTITYHLQTESDNTQTLYILRKGDAVKILNWHPGDIGITLGDGAGPGAAEYTYLGDQRAPLTGSPGALTYNWGTTSWSVDGTLTGGVSEQDFSDVIYGDQHAASDKDFINGLGGNDALDGRGGNDRIDGGAGDDLIGGGSGSDTIHGGTGNDEILSATGLNAPQRTGPNDVWQAPAGETIWTLGSTWGIYDSGNNSSIISGGGSLTLDDAPDVVYGDAGDDDIVGGHGDDYLDGGEDNDALSGNGGNDLLVGGGGTDFLRGDGSVTTGFYSTTPALLHGKDFLDGGAGNDLLFGNGNDDILLGGAENDIVWGDDTESELALQYHGKDYLDGGAGDDTLYGNGGDDTLIGGAGNDTLYGGKGFDTYLINAGEGIDHIIDTDPEKNSKIIFGNGVNSSDVKLRLGSLMLDLGSGNAVHIENFDQTDVFNSSSVSRFEFADGTTLSIEQLLARGFDLDGTDLNDTIIGSNTVDRINGLNGDDVLIGGEGDDILDGGGGADYLLGGEGDDTYLVNVGGSTRIADFFGTNRLQISTVTGSGGYLPIINVQSGDLVVVRPDGSNVQVLQALFGTNLSIRSDDGRLDIASLRDWVGTNVNLSMNLTVQNEDGNLFGGAGMDTLSGNTSANTLWGGNGADQLFGIDGNDWLIGDDGNDTLVGGEGDDTLVGGLGDDLLIGGNGIDSYRWGSETGNDVIAWQPGAENDRVSFSEGIRRSDIQLIRQANGDFVIQLLNGPEATLTLEDWFNEDEFIGQFQFADGSTIDSTELDNLRHSRITGGASDDLLLGSQFADTVEGMNGDDILDGSQGDDTLLGGNGTDTYILKSGNMGIDTVVEQTDETSVIRLVGLNFSDLEGRVDGSSLLLTWQNGNQGLKLADFYELPHEWLIQNREGETQSLTEVLVTNAAYRASIEKIAGLEETFVLDWRTRAADRLVKSGFTQLNDGTFEQKSQIHFNYDFIHFTPPATSRPDQESGYIYTTDWLKTELAVKTVILDELSQARGYEQNWDSGVYRTALSGWNRNQFEEFENIYRENRVLKSEIVNLGLGWEANSFFIPIGGTVHPFGGIVGQYLLSWEEVENQFLYQQQHFHVNASVNISEVSESTGGEIGAVELGRQLQSGQTLPSHLKLRLETINTVRNLIKVEGSVSDDHIVIRNAPPALIIKAGDGNDFVDSWNFHGEGNEETVAFLDGDGGNDTLLGTSNADVLIGGNGVNYLLGNGGSDRYVLSAGGFDIINPWFETNYFVSVASIDVLELPDGVTQLNLKSRYSVIKINGERFQTVELNWNGASHAAILLPGENAQFDVSSFDTVTVRFADGSTLGLDELLSSTPSFLGFSGEWDEPYFVNSDTSFISEWQLPLPTAEFRLGMGEAVAHKFSGGVVFDWRIDPEDVVLVKSGNDLLITFSDTSDSLRLVDWYFQDDEPELIFDDDEWSYSFASALGTTLMGSALNDNLVSPDDYSWTLIGQLGSDNIIGKGGNDTLVGGEGSDTLAGGNGDDTYDLDASDGLVDSVLEYDGEGTDTVYITGVQAYTLTANVENAISNGTGLSLAGNTLDNQLTGDAGTNTLKGNAGADTLIGLDGNDTYSVDNANDHVIENAGEGNDTVYSSVSYALPDNVENLGLIGSAAINATGNGLDNIIYGNAAANILRGGAGTDTLRGGQGNDTYEVDNAGDVVLEAAGEGSDTVYSSVSYALTDNVENLGLTGSAAINATGNGLDNIIYGNVAANTLRGGAGTDTLRGGQGNDTYEVDNTGDVVLEAAGEGSDTVYASVSYALTDNVENLGLTGSAAINATGNGLDNIIYGNVAANTLRGGAGTDTLRGGQGNDTYEVDNTGDVVLEADGEGSDTVYASVSYALTDNVENLGLTGSAAINATGNGLDNIIYGNAAANTLRGGAGTDTLRGSTGNDTYVLGRGYGADTVVENDATVGNTDVAQFLTGVSADQLWFVHAGNNLEVSIIGTSDKLVVQNWYSGSANHVEQFKTTDGNLTLLDSQVESLVSAMAAFAPPSSGQTTLPTNYQTALAPVIAANWQ